MPTEHVLAFDPAPDAKVRVTVSIESPVAKVAASFILPRYRIRAIVSWLGAWLEATNDYDGPDQ